MKCFDLNRCSCFRYAGLENLPMGWQLTPQESEFRAQRRFASSRVATLRSSQNIQQESRQSEERIESYIVAVQITGTASHGSSRVTVCIEPCPTDYQCLQIQYTRQINIIPKVRRTDRIT